MRDKCTIFPIAALCSLLTHFKLSLVCRRRRHRRHGEFKLPIRYNPLHGSKRPWRMHAELPTRARICRRLERGPQYISMQAYKHAQYLAQIVLCNSHSRDISRDIHAMLELKRREWAKSGALHL